MPSTPAPDPAHVQRNINTLSQIGGLYDLIALRVEADHAELLAAWRLDNPAKSAVELLRDRDRRSNTHTPTH